MKAKLSLEPILMLIVALSRDVLQDFLPFLQRFIDSLVHLLMNGGDRDPDVLDQVFTSWSYIVMDLKKYLSKDVIHVLKITTHLRFFSKDYVQEFTAETVSYLLRKSPKEQLRKGVRKVLLEVTKSPTQVRKTGVTALLCQIPRRNASRLHSDAEFFLRLLLDKSMHNIGDVSAEGSEAVLEVITGVFQRLCGEIEHGDLNLVYKCLIEEISSCVKDGCLVHLNRLLSLLTSTVAHFNRRKVYESETLFELVRCLIKWHIVPAETIKLDDHTSEVLNRILQLMLLLLDDPHISGDLSNVILEYAPAFKLKSSGLLWFLKGILLKEPQIAHAFRNHIIRAMDDMIEDLPQEVLFIMLTFFERQGERPLFNSFKRSEEEIPKICRFFKKKLQQLSDVVTNHDLSNTQVKESELPILWGVLSCYPCFQHLLDHMPLLMNVIDSLDKLMETEADNIASIPKSTWQSLLGAALSCHKLLSKKSGNSETTKLILGLAKRHKSCSQVLSAVAEFLDSVFGPADEGHLSRTMVLDLRGDEVVFAINTFTDNLGLPDKAIRISTLRILSHYAPLDGPLPGSDEPPHKKQKIEEAGSHNGCSQSINVIDLLLLVETTPLSISTSRKIIILISRLQTGLASSSIHHAYIPLILSGIIGVLHNRLSHLWEPALECLTVLLRKYKELTWDRFVMYLKDYQFRLLSSSNQLVKLNSEGPQKNSLDECFNFFLAPEYDCTPCVTVVSLLLQSLQKIPDIAESRSRQLVPLFLNFLGYDDDSHLSVDTFRCHKCTKKECRLVLKEWLQLFKLMRNAQSLYRSQVLKDVLANRLLDEIDSDIQLKVLECLLNWKDDFLIPYSEHLKNLIVSKSLREELTTWAVSKESQNIQEGHRISLIPIIIRLLTPKVRKLKTLASRKHTGVSHRRALLGFLAQLDVSELHLFFSLLLKPLLLNSLSTDMHTSDLDNHHLKFADSCQPSILTKSSISMPLANLSWKKQYGFLHALEDILRTFDELHVRPFLNPLMKVVAQILESCMLNITSGNGNKGCASKDSSAKDLKFQNTDTDVLVSTNRMMNTSIKQYKDLRSLCLKIICFALNKFDDNDFACDFWDTFFSSVKPLINSFKQEGSSSEKPSSLFSCFVAMSQSPKLVSLLDREATLVPTIFSILTVKTASNAIISSVLDFIENLLILDKDSDHQEGDPIKRILIPHIGTLIDCFHGLFQTRKKVYRKSSIWSKKTELRILKLLVKYINDPLAAERFIDVLLPFFKMKALHTAADECFEGLHVIKGILPVLGGKTTGKILSALHPLLVSCRLDLRMCICDILDGMALIDPSLTFLARLLHDLNAVSSSEIGELDYDTRVNAYDRIKPDTFSSLKEEHVSVILSHCIYDMSSEELIFRQSASTTLLSFIQFAASILNGNTEDCQEMLTPGAYKERTNFSLENSWTKACIQQIIKSTFLRNISESMDKDISIKKEWIIILRDMIYNLHEVPALSYFRPLCSEDPEVDFFNNILHLQTHRRVRALSRFRNVLSAGDMTENLLVKIFVPLFFNMLLDVKDGKGEHLRNACLETIASISGHMQWESYHVLLMTCFQKMKGAEKTIKIMIRLVSSILDMFHFWNENATPLVKDGGCDDFDNPEGNSSIVVLDYSEGNVPSHIKTYLEKAVFPKIKKMLNSDSEDVNVNISLTAVKLLKLLPEETMEAQLPSIIYRTCNFLKHRLESKRDEARSALAACAKELGMEKLHLVVKVLKATLKRGFELHVLGYTLNFILSKMLIVPSVGKLDHCLEELLYIAENDILGDVAEEKEVDKIASKMKETRKVKSFETLKLISQSITFSTHALKLLSHINIHIQKPLTPKKKVKLEKMLDHIAQGLECNPSAESDQLFIFAHGLIQDSITVESLKSQEGCEIQTNRLSIRDLSYKGNSSTPQGSKNSHLIAVFALGVLHNRLKNMKLDKKDEQLLSMLDPFVSLLGDCLNSKYEDVLSAGFRCLAPMIKLPLPSLGAQADKIKILLLDIAQKPGNANSLLVQSCLKLLTVLLRSTKITLSHDQLHMLIQFPVFIDLQTNPSPVALSLLKSVVGRKIVVHEIYDVVLRVGELMVTSQSEPIRKKCSQILLQFLLDYHLSDKRLQQHIDFFLTNLSYEHSSGREAVLEMLHTILVKFPKSIVDNQAQTFFLHLVVALANERDQKVRSMVSTVLKELIGHASSHVLNLILEYSLSWYMGEKQHLWSAAAQVLGLLAEVLKKGFQKHIVDIMQVANNILESCNNATSTKECNHGNEPIVHFWKEAYYSLVMLEAMVVQFPQIFYDREYEEMWEKVIKFLLHPHVWLRNISNRLVALHFAAVAEAGRANPEQLNLGATYLVNPSRLFMTAVSLLNQLKAQLSDDDATSNLITQNLVFSICNLHSFAKQKTHLLLHEFWSTLDCHEQASYLEAFELLGSRKAKDFFLLSTHNKSQSCQQEDQSDQVSNQKLELLLVAPLLKRMGKIATDMEDVQMKIIFNCFKVISSQIGSEGCQNYALYLLVPLYKVCEGFAGKVVSDEVKQLAEEVRDSIRAVISADKFVQVYNQIRKTLKERRDKRKHVQKVMAVVNPMRHAKRKLQVAAKHRAHKKRKITSMKLAKWRR